MTSINPNFAPQIPLRFQPNNGNQDNGEVVRPDNGDPASNINRPDVPSIRVPIDTLVANNGIKISTGNTLAAQKSAQRVHKISPDDFEKIKDGDHNYKEGEYLEVRFAEYTCQYYVDKDGYLVLVGVDPH